MVSGRVLVPGEGEGPLSGIPIQFSSGDGTEVLYLQSGVDGTYGLVAADFGFWNVAADPSADQGVVTSPSPRGVTLTEEAPLALGVDFCIGTARAGQVVLPASGAPAAPALWLAALVGLLLLAGGAILHVRGHLARG